ncbi:hypothetical protein MTO96_049523 [Rhipicephalus appendiculatus]
MDRSTADCPQRSQRRGTHTKTQWFHNRQATSSRRPRRRHPYAPAGSEQQGDLQGSATGYGHQAEGYLDMGAYSSGYGAFGWYADYPVGGGYH